MEKKTKLSDNPRLAKIIYSVVIAVLCITAIIVGIVAANNRDNNTLPPPDDGTNQDGGDNTQPPEENGGEGTEPEKKLTFIAPVACRVTTGHSLTIPVFSPTLEEWRVHTGIDIDCEEAAAIFAAADGEVVEIGNHPRFGYTVKIKHDGGITTIYSNLKSLSDITVKVGDKVKQGDKVMRGVTIFVVDVDNLQLGYQITKESVYINPMDMMEIEG